MSTSTKTTKDVGTAEDRFRAAFERLKLGTTQILPKGAKVSQNNVAKEAECDSSALRKARFPLLVLEIQEWVNANKENDTNPINQRLLKKRKKNREMREIIADLKLQRDAVATLLLDANMRIVELSQQVNDMSAKIQKTQPTATILDFDKKS